MPNIALNQSEAILRFYFSTSQCRAWLAFRSARTMKEIESVHHLSSRDNTLPAMGVGLMSFIPFLRARVAQRLPTPVNFREREALELDGFPEYMADVTPEQ